jgi:hypothetical protein
MNDSSGLLRKSVEESRRRHSAIGMWVILLSLIIGWGPLFVAEFVRRANPALNASYAPQAFAMKWIPVTALCSAIVAVSLFIGLVKLVFSFAKQKVE